MTIEQLINQVNSGKFSRTPLNQRVLATSLAKPQGIFAIMPFQCKENALFNKKRALQKSHFRSFAEKGRGSVPQDPQVARLGYNKEGVSILAPNA